MRTDLPHQRPVLRWALPRAAVAFLLEMRLGKSHIAIRWAEHRSSKGIKLVVAPVSTHISWCEELEADGCRYVRLHGPSAQKLKQVDNRGRAKWLLVNPEGLRACPEILAGLPISVVMLDESTFISNPQSDITRLVRLRLRSVPNRAILTGEPAPESLLQWYEQYSFLCGSPWMKCHSFWQWRARYFHLSFYDWKPHETTKRLIKREVAKSSFRMSSKKIMGHRPIYMRRHVELPGRLKKLCKEAKKNFAIGSAETKWSVAVHGWLAQICGGAIPKQFDKTGKKWFSPHKVNELKRILEGELRKKQVVVYFRYTRELLYAAKQLEDCSVIRGNTPFELRKERINDFRAGKIRILLFQARCAKYALSLWEADAAIFYSNLPDSGGRNQLEARLHNPARKGPPLYIDLVVSRTYDEALVRTLRERKWESAEMLDRVQELTDDFGD